MSERAIHFSCEGAPLLGVIHEPDVQAKTGLIIVVAGGPQYRVGVNRQFVMLARMLAAQGVVTLRFDHRGTGDSGGDYRGFLGMSEDINCAINELMSTNPDLENVILWGECESASAIAFYAHLDPRVSGIFLVNPWIRTEEGEAKTYLKHYYLGRLLDRSLWSKLVSGSFSYRESIGSLFGFVGSAVSRKRSTGTALNRDELQDLPLPQRLERSVEKFLGKVFIITSGRDFIAQEFRDYVAVSQVWKKILSSVGVQEYVVENADHSFSRLEWREELFEHTRSWVDSI